MLVYYFSLLGDDIPGVNEPNNRHNDREYQRLLDEKAKLIYMLNWKGRTNLVEQDDLLGEIKPPIYRN